MDFSYPPEVEQFRKELRAWLAANLTDEVVAAGRRRGRDPATFETLRVEAGTPIYVIATEKVEQEIEAGASGTVQWTGEVGTVYDIGVEIGVITS